MAQPPLVKKALLGAVVVLLLGIAAVAVIAKLALRPEQLRPLAEQQLTALLHVPVRIGTLDLKLLPSLALAGRDIDIGGQSNNAPPSLTVESLHLAPTLSTLLSSTIVIEKVELRGLRLNVLRDADGRWALPGPTHMAIGASTTPAAPAPPPATGSAPSAPAGSTASAATEPQAATSIEVKSFTLADGTVAVFDAGQSTPSVTVDAIAATLQADARGIVLEKVSGKVGGSRLTGSGKIRAGGTALTFTWQDLRSDDVPKLFALAGAPPRPGVVVEGERPLTVEIARGKAGMDVRGTLGASRLVLPPFTLTGIKSPFSFAGDELEFSSVQFTAYKGAFTGRAGGSPSTTPPAWHVNGTLEHLDLGEMLAATTSLGNKLAGTGRLRLDVQGRRDQAAVTGVVGTISAALTNGVIRDFPLLAAINRALAITEGSGKDTNFERLTGSFSLAGGRAATRDLTVVAGSLTVSLAGTIGLESQALDLVGAARFSREKSQELSAQSKHVSGTKNANGEVEIPIAIGGTLAAPGFTVEVGTILANAARKEAERGIRRGLNKLLKP
jgi:uncharacterized protein involved in outer membrane biogenesis